MKRQGGIFKQTMVKELDAVPLGKDPTWVFREHLKKVCLRKMVTREVLAGMAGLDPAKLIEGEESLTDIHLIHLRRMANALVLIVVIETPEGCEPMILTEHESVQSVLHYGRAIKLVEPPRADAK